MKLGKLREVFVCHQLYELVDTESAYDSEKGS